MYVYDYIYSYYLDKYLKTSNTFLNIQMYLIRRLDVFLMCLQELSTIRMSTLTTGRNEVTFIL